MKVNFKSAANKGHLTSIRSQIKSSDDLRKFDDFLANNDSFDFSDDVQVEAARFSCGGTICCPDTGPIVLTID